MNMNGEQTPIRVGHIVGKVVLGGVDAVVMNYYRHIDRSRVQFDFFMDGPGPSPIDDEIRSLGGRIYKLPAYTDGMRANLRRFRRILAENQYQIIHCHMNTLSVFWLREAKKAGIPVRIAHSHSTAHGREGLRTLMKYMLRPFSKKYATRLCACGEYAGRWLFGSKAYDSGKVTVVPNAIDIGKFRFDPSTRERMRAELGLGGKLVIGHAGRFMYPKNHRFLIRVFAEVYKQNPDSVLLLAGDGELLQKMQQLTDKLGLNNAVIFLGIRRDVHELYQAMDVFVLPSLYEGLPVVGVEAQCAGLPCVFSDKITGEAAAGTSTQFLSLKQKPAEWARASIACAKRAREQPASRGQESAACCAKWDIGESAEMLTDYYIKACRQQA